VSDLPAGTVTFLFTDLEGSTRLWEKQPDAMRDALARHDAILRDAVEKYDGQVVKTTGDGLHAAFVLLRPAHSTRQSPNPISRHSSNGLCRRRLRPSPAMFGVVARVRRWHASNRAGDGQRGVADEG